MVENIFNWVLIRQSLTAGSWSVGSVWQCWEFPANSYRVQRQVKDGGLAQETLIVLLLNTNFYSSATRPYRLS
jgi:hypothetical protein